MAAEAFQQATSGRLRPVALEMPWDILAAQGPVEPSLRAKKQNRHADAVLNATGGGAEEQVGQEAVSVGAHRHQICSLSAQPI